MDRTAYVAALRRDAARLSDAATDLSRPVPACPGWDVAELLWHTGEVHYFWRQIASGAIGGPDDYTMPARPADDELARWFRDGAEALAAVLADLDPGAPAWSWTEQQDAGFVQRRMAHETAVHCWDALSAGGRDEPVERELAVDGIDEFLTFFLPGTPEGVDADVHLHATDGDGEWLITVAGGAWRIERAHTKAPAAVRGTASDLLLLLWRRKRPESLQVFGDAERLGRFLAAARLD